MLVAKVYERIIFDEFSGFPMESYPYVDGQQWVDKSKISVG